VRHLEPMSHLSTCMGSEQLVGPTTHGQCLLQSIVRTTRC